ncbi:uncharacterized protein LOC125667002 isoform X2 [Ostrea edulis]|nr:uncharacterized protein LOC125667002 isoform X2 [Ostrea edulis]
MADGNATLFQNCTDLGNADYDEIILLSEIVGGTCAVSFIVAGIIYCCHNHSYASTLKEGELHCLLEIISIIAFVYDLSSDVFLSLQYYKERNSTYFVLTMIFIIAPVFFSYIAIVALVSSMSVKMSKTEWCGSMMAAVAFGPVGAIFGHLFVLIYSLGCGPGKRIPIKFSPAVHGMLEVNFEAIPQLLLQIYINVNTLACDQNDIKTRLLRYVAVGGSAFDIIVAMYVYKNHIAERSSPNDEIEFKVKFMSFLKKLFLIGARLVIFALFLSEFTDWFYMFAGYRFLVCAILSFVKLCFRIETQAEEKMSFIKRFVLSIIDAFLNLFIVVRFSDYKGSYLPLKRVSYVFIYCENIFLFAIWIIFTKYDHTWYYWPSIGIITAFTVCNILCELFHFKYKLVNRVSDIHIHQYSLDILPPPPTIMPPHVLPEHLKEQIPSNVNTPL